MPSRLLAFAVFVAEAFVAEAFAEDLVAAFVEAVPAFVDRLTSVLPMKRVEKCAIPMMTSPSDWPWEFQFPRKTDAPQCVSCGLVQGKRLEVHPSRPPHPLGRDPQEREVVDREQIRRLCFRNQGLDTSCDKIP